MLVINKRCKVCLAVKANKQLLKRIYESSYFVPHSKDSLLQISIDTKTHYRGLLNHVKKHQFIDSQDYQNAMLNKADKDAEKKAVIKAVRGHSVVQNIISRGQERLDAKEIDVNTDQLLRASQLQMQADDKKKDQDLMAASLAFFMSGESQANERLYVDAEPTENTPELTANN
jgi:hypothetical protein